MSSRSKYGWKTTSSKLKYRNDWISVREDKVVYPNGRPGIYGVLEKGPGVCIIPLAPDGGIYFLRQYRYTIDAVAWELPAGAMHPGEGERAAARRELAEEIGLSAGRLKRLGNFYTALGHETAEIIVYLATGLRPLRSRAERQHDESILEVRKIPPARLRRMILGNQINCGVALASLHFLSRQRKGEAS